MIQSKDDYITKNNKNKNSKNKNVDKMKITLKSRDIYKAAAIVVIILLSTVGIAAAAKLSIGDLFKGYFREPAKQEINDLGNPKNSQGSGKLTTVPMKEDNKFIEEASAIVSSSVTANGLKLTARGVVGDRHTIYIAVDVESIDGSAFNKNQQNDVKDLSFSKVWLKTNDNALGQYCYVSRVDDGSKAGKATFVLHNSLAMKERINHVSLTFTNLTDKNTDNLVDIGSWKSLFDIMNEIGGASRDDFNYMGARYSSEEDRLWYHKTEDKFLKDLNKKGIKNVIDYDSYWGKRDAYMEEAIIGRSGITPKYCIRRTENQTTFSTKYPKLAVSNIGIRNNQLCVRFELNKSMNFDSFNDMGIIIVNKRDGRIIPGMVDASQPVNGNDNSQADMVDGKIISCGAQFSGISDKDMLKDYYFAFGAYGENTLYEGDWKLDFNLDYSDTTREYTVSHNVNINGENRKLKRIAISPISLQLQFKTVTDSGSTDAGKESLFQIDNSAAAPNMIKIIMKNNTEVILENLSFDKDTLNSVLPAVIDLNQISTIEIDKTKIKLSD
ncbi:DUF4179 domain-containing protein [Anaerocolumna sp. MB42-C2]|uniref:DUF4179 domain-containing protein n=1 Tax=Anaerocolumna sp. MB42-C2 TaxID=3070997 RepID=UPI0027DFA42A|nr:DUF4179 domain-containing protein [Anaerocolumna sp. MB42-C2]WMJ86289.1 DUF4179 domain-containing protein [Anaerocolumna sp. MB42-C2]